MADPFADLRPLAAPAAPDPVFAARLRSRLERALFPRGDSMSAQLSDEPTEVATPGVVAPRPEPVRQGDVGYISLWVPDVEVSAEFFASLLGWRYTPAGDHSRLREGEDGALAPAQGLVGEAGLAAAGRHYGHPTGYLSFVVDDVDAAVGAVRAAGGTSSEPGDTPYGRIADCVDDQGMEFSLHNGGSDEGRPASNGTNHGDVSYLSIEVVDSARARAFLAAVLGWSYAPGHVAEGAQVIGTAPMIGMSGGHDHATVVPSYRVDDIRWAVATIRDQGGTSTEPAERPYGMEVAGTDPRGLRFYLHQM